MPKQAGAPLVRKLQPHIRRADDRGYRPVSFWPSGAGATAEALGVQQVMAKPCGGRICWTRARYDRCPLKHAARTCPHQRLVFTSSRHPPLPASAAWGSHARCFSVIVRVRGPRPRTTHGSRIANSLDATDREINNVAHALAEQTAWSWQAVDLLLRDTARGYTMTAATSRRNASTRSLRTARVGVRQSTPGHYRRCTGHASSRSRDPHRPICLLRPPRISSTQRDRTVSGRVHERTDHHSSENRAGWFLSRRLENDRAFRRRGDSHRRPRRPQRFYQAVNLGQGQRDPAMREDGTLLVRNPAVTDVVGQKIPPPLVDMSHAPPRDSRNPIDRQAGLHRRRARDRHSTAARGHTRRKPSRCVRGATKRFGSGCERSC